jgi:methyl-accepting chemotaxis protein
MRWFANMRTGMKLSLTYSIIFLMLLTVMMVSYSTIMFLDKTNKTFLNHDLILLEELIKLRDNESDIELSVLKLSILSDPAEIQQTYQFIKKTTNERNVLYQDILNLQKDNPIFLEKYNEIVKLRNEIDTIQEETFFPLINSGKLNDARILASGSQYQNYDKLGNLTVGLLESTRKNVVDTLVLSNKEVLKASVLYLIMGVSAFLIIIGFIWTLNRLIVRPLKEISSAAESIALGDIASIHLSSLERRDEVGVLANSFSKMILWLQTVAASARQISTGDLTTEIKLQSTKDVLGKAFQKMGKNLHQLSSEMSESINLLETSVSQISAATSQLVSSSSETATAISQTTSTIEEVKQTSLMASEKAKSILDASQNSTEVSKKGKRAADEMNEMANQMQNQMDLIAESMVRLSEQSQSIGTIITAVEDMAQQSNLLSVNASIEAAKAGEQGRGFAIVAQEVKTLANQSKQATSDVRAVLSDIQKATSAAVMATEQGSKSVEAGVKKSEETGQSILTLVNTVTESSRDASQISATTQQQLVGMEQAAVAMENIKTATFQNVDGSKQLELAANSIKEIGKKLKQLVSRYKLKKMSETDLTKGVFDD